MARPRGRAYRRRRCHTTRPLGGEFAPGVRYPYPFMNVEVNGLGDVILWIVGLTVALVGVGYVYYALDRLLARVGAPRPAVARA